MRGGLRLAGLAAALVLAAARLEAASEERALLELTVNQVPKGEALAVLRDADVLVPADTLEEAGLQRFEGRRETIDRRTFVALSSLAPGVSYELDERALALRLTVKPELLGATVVKVQSTRPANLVYARNSSTFLNYALNWRSGAMYDLSAESGVSVGGALVTSTLSRTQTGAWLRGHTRAIFDDRQRLLRWTAGDAFGHTGLLGGSALMSGLSFSREYSLDPYLVLHPVVTLTGAAETPSILDVYVNNRRVRQEQVQPGLFDVSDLPVSSGSGTASVVIRDAFGRRQEISTRYYLTTRLLAPGLHEFGYHVGVRRNRSSTASWDYDTPLFLGRHRVGLTDRLTAGFRAEASRDMASGGLLVATGGPFGEVELAAGVSRARDRWGSAWSASYGYAGRPVSVGVAVRAMSPTYTNVTLEAAIERPRLELDAYTSLSIPGGSLSVQHTLSDPGPGQPTRRTALIGSTRLGGHLDLLWSGARSRQPGSRSTELFVGLGIHLGRHTLATIGHTRQDATRSGTLDVQRSAPAGPGFGYRLTARDDERRGIDALVEYHASRGYYELAHEVVNGRRSSRATVAGGVVAAGRSVYLSRPVQDAFAVVDVPGAPNVRVYSSNQEVGRTNRKGTLLVPNLLPYYGNRLSIADEDVSMEYSVRGTERVIAPPYRGGAYVRFPVRRVQGASGVVLLQVDGEAITPSYGELTVSSGREPVSSPIGSGGEFYLEDLAPGAHRAVVEFEEFACDFELSVPASDAPVVNLGTLRCVMEPDDEP